MGKLRNHLFPHNDNDHKPHLLREASVAVLVLVIVSIFTITALQTRLISKHSHFLAAVLPSVLVDLANEDREEKNLPPLQVDDTLGKAAQMKADHMAEHGYFSHYSPTGETPWTWFHRAGYDYVHAGENLAVNFTDSEDVERAWMRSAMHRQNLLDANFTRVGIATARGEYKGQETVFVVQMFAKPAVASAQEPSTGSVAGATQVKTEEEPVVSADPVVSEGVAESETDTTTTDTGGERIADAAGAVSQKTEAATSSDPVPVPIGSVRTDSAGGTPQYASVFEHLTTQPRKVMEIMYLTLAALIMLSLVAMVGIEVKKQHPKHAFYGVSLLVLILVFTYFGQVFLFPSPIVI